MAARTEARTEVQPLTAQAQGTRPGARCLQPGAARRERGAHQETEGSQAEAGGQQADGQRGAQQRTGRASGSPSG